jgi:Kef-type K+ transport system membrane component KefB/mannitol/fructose-specific phosphotransferase system IIA component (Ntr-type)
MGALSADEITRMFVALGVLLGVARILGELAQWLHQPAVVGEILAGVLLGPTVLGSLAPDWNAWLFPAQGDNAIVLSGLTTFAIVLFLLVAGLEVDLSTIWRQGRAALGVGVLGTLIPFAIGLVAAWFAPGTLGRDPDGDRLIFALFFATAMAISALPVIAKTLMDLGLYRTDIGMIVVSAAIVNDVAGWLVFAVILGMMGKSPHGFDVPTTIALTLGFALLTLTVGRWLVNRILPYLQAYTHWPGGELSFALILALFGAALTEWIGIHAIFGSFLVGIAIGDSEHLRERTRVMIDQFISFIFAPLFFASIGLRVNFVTSFDFTVVAAVLVIACVGKLLGSWLGAKWGGLPPRDSWAVGFAMNARGAMEIILGVLALQAEVIRPRLFVALVIMALVTSIVSGPAMRSILGLRRPRRLANATSSRLFVRDLKATSAKEAIAELAQSAASALAVDAGQVEENAWFREQTLPTGIGNGVALPHARLETLPEPAVVVGLSDAGIDFDAPDGEPAHVIFLILTAKRDAGAQLEISAEIGRLFSQHGMLERFLRTRGYAEFLALVRSTDGGTDHSPRAGT